jgi:hypothetical protein
MSNTAQGATQSATIRHLTDASNYGGAIAYEDRHPCVVVYGVPCWVMPNGNVRVGDPNAPMVARTDAPAEVLRQRNAAIAEREAYDVPVVVCVRDPDADNAFRTFGGNVHVIDIDAGRGDLNDDEYAEGWAESILLDARQLEHGGKKDAAEYVEGIVADYVGLDVAVGVKQAMLDREAHEAQVELARLEATFAEQGGRGVDLAERIDALRKQLG